MKKVLLPILALVLALGLALPVAAHTEDDPFTTNLIAGQHEDVGDVKVWNDGTNLYVQYVIDAPWVMTESHLYVGKTDPVAFPSTPGQFPYSPGMEKCPSPNASYNDAAMTYTIPLAEIYAYQFVGTGKGKGLNVVGEPGVEPCNDVWIAAHAVVQQVITQAPYYASTVVDYDQGLRKDGEAVESERSTPEQGLALEKNKQPTDFFSLGFGGWITVEFDCTIRNGEGNDVGVWEDTWGAYPVETAGVYASQDGINWTPLGTADNSNQNNTWTLTQLDLGTLSWAKYIKVMDTTDPTVHGGSADGFDLNAVVSLQDCIQEETAWGEGDPFGTNWAMYFDYHIQEPCVSGAVVNGGFEFPVVNTAQKWDIYDSGTSGLGWTVEWYGGSTSYGGWTRPEPAHLELHRGVLGAAYEGSQYAELDTDWDGSGGGLNNEPASVKIYQDIDTCPNKTYTLTYAWRLRPNYGDNELEVWWNGSKLTTHSGSGGGSTIWNPETHSGLTVTGTTTHLEFIETGNPDSLGMFLDAVSVVEE